MSGRELFEFLKKNTNMTEKEIQRDIDAGAMVYSNDVEGFKEFFDNCVGALCDEEDIPDMWVNLELIKDVDTKNSIRVDWVL